MRCNSFKKDEIILRDIRRGTDSKICELGTVKTSQIWHLEK